MSTAGFWTRAPENEGRREGLALWVSAPSHRVRLDRNPFVSFGSGSGISFHVDGDITVQTAGAGQGPWEVDGSFTPTQSF